MKFKKISKKYCFNFVSINFHYLIFPELLTMNIDFTLKKCANNTGDHWSIVFPQCYLQTQWKDQYKGLKGYTSKWIDCSIITLSMWSLFTLSLSLQWQGHEQNDIELYWIALNCIELHWIALHNFWSIGSMLLFISIQIIMKVILTWIQTSAIQCSIEMLIQWPLHWWPFDDKIITLKLKFTI